MRRSILMAALVLLSGLAACQNTPARSGDAASLPTVPLFPTVTRGVVVRGVLPLAASGDALGNPATAIARANAPSPTPDLRACPAANAAAVLPPNPPGSARAIEALSEAYLSAGGDAALLEARLREWGLLGGSGRIIRDLDLTGEGTNDFLISAIAPGEGGMLAILVCAGGTVVSRYAAVTGGDAPQILNAADMNYDGLPELMYTSLLCGIDNLQSENGCEYVAQIASWNTARGRFVNLFDRELHTASLPTIEDFDADQVSEVVARQDFDGDAQTGPLRTGFTVYDWNGAVYTRSIRQLDPPRFRIQVVQQADNTLSGDNAFAGDRITEAESLYQLAIDDPSLENWQNDDTEVLRAYALYRLLLIQTFADDERRVATHARILADYPDDNTDAVFAEMAKRFWDVVNATNDLSSACAAVQDILILRPEALGLLNRYGTQNAPVTAQAVCPY